MRAKAKKTPMCSVSLIAIELKGLAAPGEALKNISTVHNACLCFSFTPVAGYKEVTFSVAGLTYIGKWVPNKPRGHHGPELTRRPRFLRKVVMLMYM